MSRIGRISAIVLIASLGLVVGVLVWRGLLPGQSPGPSTTLPSGRSPGGRTAKADQAALAEDARVGVISGRSHRDDEVPSSVAQGALVLDVPSPADADVRKKLSRAEMHSIWMEQDEVMSEWPPYSEVREQLAKELALTMDLEKASVEEFRKAAVELRDRFWQAGGNSAYDSYHHAYAARVLLELAHEREPDNLKVTDELVETIQAATPLWTHDAETGERRIRDQALIDELLGLRNGQFKQIRSEIREGRRPTWDSFVVAVDVASLAWTGSTKDTELASETVNWLLDKAESGGWTYYNDVLETFLARIRSDQEFRFNIYVPCRAKWPDECAYARRSPGFVGPHPEERGMVLWGQLSPDQVTHSQ